MRVHREVRKVIVNVAVALTLVTAVLILVSSFFTVSRLDHVLYGFADIIATRRLMRRLGAIFLMVVAWNLYLRKRAAWVLTVILLSVNLLSHFLWHVQIFTAVIMVLDAIILTVLIVFHSDFNRRSNPLTVRRSVWISAIGLIIVFINATISHYLVNKYSGTRITLWASLGAIVQILLGNHGETGLSPAMETVIFLLFWACVVISLFLVLSTALHGRKVSTHERAHARNLVKKYGQNPSSYLALESDKLLFLGESVEGLVAYGIVADVIIVDGDPICAPDDFPTLLEEFEQFCALGPYQFVFLGTTEMFLDAYESRGYGHVKCGQEARFELAEYNLKGNKVAKMRAQINHARKAGLTVHEYRPLDHRDKAVEAEITSVSEAWLKGKKSGQLGFAVGGINLDDPMDRRYFYARDSEGRIVAFNVFLPFACMDGYLADVTRRVPHAPGGATELITYDAFMAFRDEGTHWGSMGLSPLADVHEDGVKDSGTARLLQLIYERGNAFYGFKDLHTAKVKYNPTNWEPSFFVFSTRFLTPQMVYAIIKIQNPQGISDFVKSYVDMHRKSLKAVQ